MVKSALWFLAGFATEFILAYVYGPAISNSPQALAWFASRVTVILLVLVPAIIGILLWKQSKAYAAGVAVSFLLVLFLMAGI
ncbi:MAG: hypothetical protein WCO69_01990 [Candidatus Omnitrophota bacterium]